MACRRFTDNAGYTRHCWECTHATDWHDENEIESPFAMCNVDGRRVSKYDSQNNPCSVARGCFDYAGWEG